MPHATGDETPMEGTDEDAAIRQYLGGDMNGGGPEQFEGEFDQSGKADDAMDFEDISDDDLPEEEEATQDAHADGDAETDSFYNPMSGNLDGLPTQPPDTNGYPDTHESTDELFGDTSEDKDLWGEHTSSPEMDRHPQHSVQPPAQRLGGLSLPSKSGLSLPGFAGSFPQSRTVVQHSPSSLSPPGYQDQKYAIASSTSPRTEDDEEGLDQDEIAQMRLFKQAKRRFDNKDELETEAVETDMALFNALFSSYEETHAPRFVELFPPRNVEYKGKAPVKPPKAVQPTKLSLDLIPDQERSFRALAATNKAGQDSSHFNGLIFLAHGNALEDDSDDDLDSSALNADELVGGVSNHDLALICQDWDVLSIDSTSTVTDFAAEALNGEASDGDWDATEHMRPAKKRKTDILGSDVPLTLQDLPKSFEDPERTTAKLAKAVALDLNDPNLLIDEHAPRTKRKLQRIPGDTKRDNAVSRDIARRYNISNDSAYEALKENHQHKVRSTLGSMAVEHSGPAAKLQYPFYKVSLDSKAKRGFHRPHLELKLAPGREYRFQKPKHIKKKNIKGREAKEIFAKAEDLSLGDNASVLLLEYSEEAPMMMSNFGMGNRLINYYRKLDPDDQNRPKGDIGETQVLLTQDKSPFANFGQVKNGSMVPTIQNGLYRAPIFSHAPKTTDFIIGVSSTYESGDRLFLRNAENLHVVGQQLPLAEVPGQHSRKVTDAAKKRLRALAYRLYTKSLHRRDKVLDNATLMPHLPGHDMPQTRSKMREFMKYEKVTNKSDGGHGVWVPQPGSPVPDAETLRSWIRPEDVCLLDSMQVGVQHLADLGIVDTKNEEQDVDEGSIELQLAPWRATKNFLNACQGKAMLKIHGEGDPTGRGEGFNFVKTSMKGGFKAVGESVEDKLNAKRRKDTGGHSYNVADQQQQYEQAIERIWNKQRSGLESREECADDEMEDETPNQGDDMFGRVTTPRSSFSTPAFRYEDESASQFSGHSVGRDQRTLVIKREGGVDKWGQPREAQTEIITDPKVIKAYMNRKMQQQLEATNITNFVPSGNAEEDELKKQHLLKELARVQRNAERREHREKLKAKQNAAGSPATAASPGPSEVDGPSSAMTNGGADGTLQKGKGRSKDGTQRKCANCGLVGHIKTNRKLCPMLNGTAAKENAGMDGDSSFGAVPAPLTL